MPLMRFLPSEDNPKLISKQNGDRQKHWSPFWSVSPAAKSRGLAGATVLRGMMGFGAHSKVIHTFKIERLSEELPIVIEIVDSQDKIEDFLAYVEGMIKRGMFATVERVQVHVYRGGETST